MIRRRRDQQQQKQESKSESNSSKKALGMLGVNFCFVKYSEIEDLKQKSNAASLAVSRLAKSCADIKLMSMRPEVRPEVGDVLLQKLTDMSVTRASTLLLNKISEANASRNDMARILKSIVSPLQDSANGRKRKSQRK